MQGRRNVEAVTLLAAGILAFLGGFYVGYDAVRASFARGGGVPSYVRGVNFVAFAAHFTSIPLDFKFTFIGHVFGSGFAMHTLTPTRDPTVVESSEPYDMLRP